MKNSIKLKLFLSITIILIVTMFLGLFLNQVLYSKYYNLQEKKKLLSNAKKIDTLIENKNYSSTKLLIQNLSENNGYTIHFNKIPGFNNPMNQRHMTNEFMNSRYNPLFKTNLSQHDLRSIKEKNYLFDIYYNNELESNFLRLKFLTDKNYILVIESPLEIINNFSKVNRKFYMYLSIIMLLLGGIFSYILSKHFTEPIIKLNNQAKAISNLNFNYVFKTKSNDEISDLGKNMNNLSQTLKTTIKKLNMDLNKKANLEESRKEFIANVSHELKTPIALIQGHAEGLRYEDVDKEKYINIILDETEKMNYLVEDLLEVSNLNSGISQLNYSNFDLSSLIDEILYKYNEILKNNQIKIKVEKKDILMAYGDKKRIKEVFINYLNNAINHLDENREIKILLTETSKKIRVNVFNTGKNIPPNQINKIWESFYKKENSKNITTSSTGLGLYLVKVIMNSHKTDFGVENKKNGVNFYFEINSSIKSI